MKYENYYSGGEFEPLKNAKVPKKPREKKFWRRIVEKIVDTVLSTISQIVFLYFEKKFESAFA